MSLNLILAQSESVTIEDRRLVGQMVTRNQKIYTSEQKTFVPFKFTFKPNSYQFYSQSRSILSVLRLKDRSNEQYLNFGTTGWRNYIAYQGTMTSAQIATCTWNAATNGTSFYFTAGFSSSTPITFFKTGDFVQLGRYAYIVTSDVTVSTVVSGALYSLSVHRTLIGSFVSGNLVVGEYGNTVSLGGSVYVGITFPVILQQYPTYILRPITNDSFIEWSGDFVAMESIL
jgi:hypothetical protein